jgi:hypothetical protein
MQIDFHHGATYVIARFAGMDHAAASVVAHASQYVDDATNSGRIEFDNGAMYERISSAHKMLDYRNFEALATHLVWIPFHFLPGNGGLPSGQSPEGDFIEKLVCTPDSFVARDMVHACLARRKSPEALHRLGITLHIYADTWAHQGFAGVSHRINGIKALDDHDPHHNDLGRRLKTYFGDAFDTLTGSFVGEVFPLGHGAALSFPDRPYLRWRYRDGRGRLIERDNPADFLAASDAVYRVIKQFVSGDVQLGVERIPGKDRDALEHCFRAITDEEGEARHAQWLTLLREGHFSFGPASVSYIPHGDGSWRHLALGITEKRDEDVSVFRYSPAFLTSHWTRFHNALQATRLTILHDVLPQYDICAA